MTHRHRILLALSVLPLAPCAPRVEAWTPRTRVEMADDAVKMMPPSLRIALERHRDDLLRGALDPMVREDDPEHRPPWSDGTLDAEIAARAAALVRAAEAGKPFADLARAFGGLAHYVADAGFPPGAAGDAGAAHYTDFGAFCESRRPRIPLVFNGHEDPDLERGDFRAFAVREMRRAAREYDNVRRAYDRAGTPPDPSAFDDRSVPFAVASLSYSRTVTLIVRSWLAAWGRAHGDLGRTPYLENPAPYSKEGTSR